MSAPLVCEPVSPALTVPAALRALQDWSGLILFDSALPGSRFSEWSFLTARPYETIVLDDPAYGIDPFARLRERFPATEANTRDATDPPFQGGAAGLLSYELGRCFERLPCPQHDEFALPAAWIGLYDWTLAWKMATGECWFLANARDGESSHQAETRASELRREIKLALSRPSSQKLARSEKRLELSPSGFLLDEATGLRSNFDERGYCEAVQQVIERIFAGDIFQANLSQRLIAPATSSPVEQYLKLRTVNPAPFAGLLSTEDWAVLSSSPERFLQLRNREAFTRPIKGTRQRRKTPEADLFTRDELRESEKDRAENVMIVDLLRNDFSRVCRPGSIRVPELCQVEAYETVTHLVSEVRGELRDGMSFWDLLAATFPGGSITGAPKIRAMEIITEVEQVARGAYCGSLFYMSQHGHADSSILIRTMTQRDGWLQLPAGGGIVAQSDPKQEYEETLHKARGMLRSLK